MGELLNLVGLSTGVVLYAMLLAMALRAGRRAAGGTRIDPLPVVTALLGLIWNVCSLPSSALITVGATGRLPFVTALACSALGFLPAVVVHSVLRGERDTPLGLANRAVTALAYAVFPVIEQKALEAGNPALI